MSFAEFFNVYLPIAQVPVNVLYLTLISLMVGIISGVFGLGGGIIMLPILTFLGVPTRVSVASIANLITASSFSGYLAYARKKRIDYVLGMLLLAGGVIGVFAGVMLFNYLSYLGKIDMAISIIFIIILSAVSIVTGIDSLFIITHKLSKREIRKHRGFKVSFLSLPYKITFSSCRGEMSVFSPIILGVFGGILISLTGIGGSLIIVPAMIYILRVSDTFTAGTTHFQLIFTSIIATILHGLSSNSLDIVLSAILILGNVFGVQIGVRFASKFQPDYYRIILSIVVMGLCLKVAHNLFSMPKELYVIERFN